MNVYIYDDFLNKSKYSKTINKVEIRLTDLGLNGKIIRLGSIKNSKDIIQNEIKSGVRNITAVGNNQTVNKVIGAIIDNDFYDFLKDEIIFSIIPIGSDSNSIASSLGIKDGENACNIILARRIEKISIGEINNGESYFINKVEIPANKASITVDNSYSIEPLEKDLIKIINLATEDEIKLKQDINPNDDLLDIIVGRKTKNMSSIKAKLIDIQEYQAPAFADETVEIKDLKQLKISKKKIRMIVGKERSF